MAKQMAANYRKACSLIILARDKGPTTTNQDYQALLFSRHEKASFMPNSSVFPGGVCEAVDESPLWSKYFEKLGVGPKQLELIPGPKDSQNQETENFDKELSKRITAIRETFEEVGILLCRDRRTLDVGSDGYGHFFEEFDRLHWQQLVHKDSNKFLTLCEDLEVVPDVWSLYEWSNWFTPSVFQKRFYTHFYLVALKEKPQIIVEKNEVKSFSWKAPLEYLQTYFNKEHWLPPPQFYELSRLLNYNELEKLKNFARERSSQGVISILPVQYKCTDGQVSILPGDDIYPKDPNACNKIISANMTIEEFRNKAKHVHRLEHYSMHDTIIQLNFKPPCDHLRPINKHPRAINISNL